MPVVEKVSGGTVRVRGIGEFSPGDQAEVSTAEAEYLVDRDDFELVDDHAAGSDGPADEDVHEEDGPPDGESDTLPFDPSNITNDEIADKVADIDDAETLRALRNLEAEQKERNGALDAIDERLDGLED